MFTKDEILDAIDELEEAPATFQNAEKLATFYSLYDHLYVRKEPMMSFESVKEVIIDRYGDSEFLQIIEGKYPEDIWLIMDELMDAVRVLQPKLYNATIEKLKGG